jgi:hypothetical protein
VAAEGRETGKELQKCGASEGAGPFPEVTGPAGTIKDTAGLVPVAHTYNTSYLEG